MNSSFRIWLMLPVLVAAMLVWSATTFGQWDVQEKCTNTVVDTAYDLTKVVEGEWDIKTSYSDRFGRQRDAKAGGNTVIHWDQGAVVQGDWTYACFSTTVRGSQPPVLAIKWTDQDSAFVDDAAPAVSVSADETASGTLITVEHTWREWIGTGWPPESGDSPGDPIQELITGTDVYYAVSEVHRPLEDLNESLFTDPGISWQALPGFALNYGESESYNIGHVPSNHVVIFRFRASGGGLSVDEIIQFRGSDIGLPSLTGWGLLLLALLVLASGVWVALRRRRAARAMA